MSTFTWTTAASGDWTTGADWIPTSAPNALTAAAVLPGAASGGYAVTIGVGESEIVNAITLGDPIGGHVGPTLSVAGTLTFAGTNPNMAFLSGKMQIGSGGVLAGAGSLGSEQGPGPFVLVNDGTVLGNAGTEQLLGILTGFTNTGTVLADDGSVGIEGSGGLTNLSGTTLTGGTWIAQGPTVGTDNQIEFGFNFDAVIGVDVANIILDGAASDIDGYAGPTGSSGSSHDFQPIEQQLQTIASGGTLQLLDNRGYSTTNALTDDGLLVLQGGTLATDGLAINSTGTLNGFGVVTGGISGLGTIVATGGALDLEQATGSVGTYTVASSATLILHGGVAGIISNNGALYVASGVLAVLGSFTSNGAVHIENGAELQIGGGSGSQDITFDGSNATLDFLDPQGFSGTLVGFGQGDILDLSVGAGTAVTSATISGSSLVLMDNATTLETFQLAGSYQSNADFTISNPGNPGAAGQVTLTYNGPAPMRQDFTFTISVDDTAALGTAEDDAIANDLSAAAEDWAQYLTGYTTLRIQLNIVPGMGGTELADAGPTEDIGTGTTLDGRQLDDPTSLIAMTTGNYAPGTTSDITVNFQAGNLGSIYVNPLPTPIPSGTVPGNEYDLVTVFRHELAHGFGFGGLTTPDGSLGSQETYFDHYIGSVSGTVVFTGLNAEAAYGDLLGTDVPTPVPLTTLNNGEGYAHFANSTSDPDADDLMSGLGLTPGTQRDISAMDLAVLEDIGAPVTAGVAVAACFAAGTLIGTLRGEVAVEELLVGDRVLVVGKAPSPLPPPARGGGGLSYPFDAKRVIWIGHRTVDCMRHPSPRNVWPVRIRAGAFGDGVPRRDLWLSPDHAVFFANVLIPVKCLINAGTIMQVAVDTITYYHVELQQHGVLLAEGLAAESYLDTGDRSSFANGGGSVPLYPDFASRIWDAKGCAPLVVAGPQLDAARSHVANVRSQARHRHGAPGR